MAASNSQRLFFCCACFSVVLLNALVKKYQCKNVNASNRLSYNVFVLQKLTSFKQALKTHLLVLNKAAERLSLFFSSTFLPIMIRTIFYVDVCVCVVCVRVCVVCVCVCGLSHWLSDVFDVLLYAPRAVIRLIGRPN